MIKIKICGICEICGRNDFRDAFKGPDERPGKRFAKHENDPSQPVAAIDRVRFDL